MTVTPAQQIRTLLAEDRPLVMGGVYDALSTRLADQSGFEILFVGGFSVAATLLGDPDLGYVTQTHMADTARRICRLTKQPLLVDADTGYGNALSVMRTAELYHEAGAAGLFEIINAGVNAFDRAVNTVAPYTDEFIRTVTGTYDFHSADRICAGCVRQDHNKKHRRENYRYSY